MAKKSTAKSASSAPSPSKPAKSTVSKRAGARAADTTTGSPPARRPTKSKASETAAASPARTASATGGRKKPARKTAGIMPFSEEAVRLEAWLVFEERLTTGRVGDHLSDWAEAQARLTAATTAPEPSRGVGAATA